MVLNTKRIHNSFWTNFLAKAQQMPSKVLFVGKKPRRPPVWSLLAKIVIVGNSKWVFLYLIISLFWYILKLRGSINFPPLATDTEVKNCSVYNSGCNLRLHLVLITNHCTWNLHVTVVKTSSVSFCFLL